LSASLTPYLPAIAAINSAHAAVDEIVRTWFHKVQSLIAATVRHAITQDAKEAGRILTLFKRMLPKNLAALEM
jgi:hypothetical protein